MDGERRGGHDLAAITSNGSRKDAKRAKKIRNTEELAVVTLSEFVSRGVLRRKFSEGSRFGREIPFDPAQGMLRWSLVATIIGRYTRAREA